MNKLKTLVIKNLKQVLFIVRTSIYRLDYVKLFYYYYYYIYYYYFSDSSKTNNMSHKMGHILATYGKEKRMIRTEELLARGIADHNRFIA